MRIQRSNLGMLDSKTMVNFILPCPPNSQKQRSKVVFSVPMPHIIATLMMIVANNFYNRSQQRISSIAKATDAHQKLLRLPKINSWALQLE